MVQCCNRGRPFGRSQKIGRTHHRHRPGSGDRTDTRHGHKSADLRVTAHQLHNLAVKIADLLLDGIARLEQRSDRSYHLGAPLGQLLGSHGEDIKLGTADDETEVLKKAANMVLEVALEASLKARQQQRSPKIQFSRDFWDCSIFDFCNSIPR